MDIGTRISHYVVLRRLGAGGMGEVYAATDERTGREVALKVLPEAAASDPRRCERFLREGRATARLDHPSIRCVYETGDAPPRPFIAMELVTGDSLEDLLADYRALPVRELVVLSLQLAGALEEAHAKGTVHRDIKPANIIVTAGPRAKLLDFGIAKVRKEQADGDMAGTVTYMSPEQALGKQVDARSDLFSLGAVMYEMATGHRPFEHHLASEVVAMIVGVNPPPIAQFNPGVPAAIERIVRKCMEKDPRQRYQSARELRLDLERWRKPPQRAWWRFFERQPAA